MDLGIHGKVAIVLGAGGGLGGAIAQALAGEGVKVAAFSLHEERARATADAIVRNGGHAIAIGLDLNDIAQIDEAVTAVEKALGPVDILVNNTGGPPPTPATSQPADLWTSYFRSMVLSVISLTDRVLPGMKERSWGRIITSTSSGVLQPIPNLGISNSLRISLVGWSKTLSREVASQGVTANIVVPGRIATDRTAFIDGKNAERSGKPLEEIVKQSSSLIPVGRYGSVAEYADVVTFLASAKASYITGSVIRVDGGLVQAV